jgi:hypothetical protein
MEEADLLGLFAVQAAVALDLLQRSRSARAVLAGGAGEAPVLTRLAAALESAEGPDRETALELLGAVARLLSQRE